MLNLKDLNSRYLQLPAEGTLIIDPARIDDEGIYQCFATNNFGTSMSIEVYVGCSESLCLPFSIKFVTVVFELFI